MRFQILEPAVQALAEEVSESEARAIFAETHRRMGKGARESEIVRLMVTIATERGNDAAVRVLVPHTRGESQ